jgi:16S rRNA (cytosine1402-N4)-methyltransferase
VLFQYADERRSRRIARAICRERESEPIDTAGRLASIVERTLGRRRGRIHPATRTFMAIRMWVNDEVENLRAVLGAAPGIVRPGGRAAVISFHSTEDRLVKWTFRRQAKEGIWQVLTRRPLQAGDDEVASNPRARSAKLRAVERTAAM